MTQGAGIRFEILAMTRLFCVALLALSLAACGGTSNDTPFPTHVTESETTIPIVKDGGNTNVPPSDGASSTPVPDAPAANDSCGEIVLRGNPPHPIEEGVLEEAGNCLAQAFQTCRPAVLTIRDEPNNLTRQFSVNPEGTDCVLRQALQTDPNTPPAVADCQRVRADSTALVVEGCSHLGDFTLNP